MNISIDSGNKIEAMNDSERTQYDVLFSIADADRDLKINGLEGFNYFAQSGLPRDVLARVWTLSDVGSKGYLTPIEFRVATHLVFCLKRGERLPTTLPASLHASAQDKKMQQPTLQATSLTPDWEIARNKATELMKLTFIELEAGKLTTALEHAQAAGGELLPYATRLHKEMEICRSYTQALEILIEQKICDEQGLTSLSACLSRFLGEIPLQPKHQAICLRMTIAKNSAVENYGVTARAIRSLMRLNPAETANLQPRLDFCGDMNYKDNTLPAYECYHCHKDTSSATTDCAFCGAPIHVNFFLEQRKISAEIVQGEDGQEGMDCFNSGIVVKHTVPIPQLRGILKGGNNWTPRPKDLEEDDDESTPEKNDTNMSQKKGVMLGGCQSKWMSPAASSPMSTVY